jgi:hypothetical protein
MTDLCEYSCVHPQFKRSSGQLATWVYILLVGYAISFVSPHYSMDGIVDQNRISVLEKINPRIPDQCHEKQKRSTDLPLIISASGLSFCSSPSLLRFDFKQNLRTWPVLATGIQRSPPTVAS